MGRTSYASFTIHGADKFTDRAIYGRNHFPVDLPCNDITHVLYAFANVRPENGQVYLTDSWADSEKHFEGDSWNDEGQSNLYGCLKQFNLLKRKHRSLKVLLSIGGWTYSANFAAPASNAAGRETFARSAVEIVKDYGFEFVYVQPVGCTWQKLTENHLSGLDIDWEYPATTQDADNYVLLLESCRKALDKYGLDNKSAERFVLTIASPAGPAYYTKLRLREMHPLLDFFNVMCYDYAGSWSSRSDHQANWFPIVEPSSTGFSTATALDDYLAAGVPPSKLVVGMPLYGRAFAETAGYGEPYHGVGPGSFEAGVWDFKALPLPGASEQEDHAVLASWSYDSGSKTFITYDTTGIALLKADLINAGGLGGAMWWESSGDRAAPEGTIGQIAERFRMTARGLENSRNTIDYPRSRFANVRNGFC